LKFTYEEILNMIHQIVKGYVFLKNHKIIHRDLKPENILVQSLENPTYKVYNPNNLDNRFRGWENS
jgi:serine/threonine protein kinase